MNPFKNPPPTTAGLSGVALVPPADRLRAAWSAIRGGRYDQAVALLADAGADDPQAAGPLRLAKNLSALREHRPKAAAAVEAAGVLQARQTYPPVPTPSGRPVPAYRAQAGRAPVPVTTNDDPDAAATAAVRRLSRHLDAGKPVVFGDLIDGYLVGRLAASPPTLEHGQEQAVYLVETDPHLVVACLLIHDWSGERGPIADPRFTWRVGPQAYVQFEALLRRDRMRPTPVVRLGREKSRSAMKRLLDRVHAANKEAERRWHRRTAEHYAGFAAAALTVGTARRPKVLLLASRFTTRPTHRAADCEQAFARLGWRTQILTEPTPAHRLTGAAVAHALAMFRPDLVFAIDRLRPHCRTPIPAELPYACWVQNQLPHLAKAQAEPPIGRRDFVLSMLGPTAARRHGYPARQIVEMPKLTRSPIRPLFLEDEPDPADGDDLAYVSTASDRPEALLEQLAPDPVLAAAGREVVEIYARGESLPTVGDVGRIVDAAAVRAGTTWSPAERSRAVHAVFHPLNDALYRQQGLRWAAAAADAMGLTFGLYGPGWENHPEFARFARGPVEHGPDLETLTRGSQINLHIAPAYCLHPRLLDGLVAGGFFLTRRHPSDTLMPRLLAALDPDAQTEVEARAHAGSAEARRRLDALLHEARGLADLGTPVDLVQVARTWQRGELANTSGAALPRLDEVSFGDADTLRQRLQAFLGDAPLRHEIAEAQRESVRHRLTYTAGLRRVTKRIGRLIADERAVSAAERAA
ncbi:MAG: hypothetical protein AAFX76_03750 [Planctomycetota bacterium]